jgi:signal transduction histidine kinase/CheY-like chemotaxis protein
LSYDTERQVAGAWALAASPVVAIHLVAGLIAVRGGNGQVQLSGLVRDLSALRACEQRLAVSERRFAALARASADLTYRIDPDWTATQQLAGQNFVAGAGGVQSAWMDGFIPVDAQAGVRVVIDEAIRNKSVFELEHRVRRVDGSGGWALSRAVPICDHGGAIVEWVGTATDVSERRAWEERLRAAGEANAAAKEAAEAANAKKSAFLANVSHEIRTPLGIILGFAELALGAAYAEADRIQALETIRRNGQQLAQLVEDLLDLSKIEAGHLEIVREPVDLDEFLDQLMPQLVFKASEKGLALELIRVGNLPRQLSTDALRLRQCLLNVVGNALKFTERGTVRVTIRATRKVRKGCAASVLEFRVRDTGIGLGAEQRAKIFQPFVQADSSTTRRYGGTGLGLALSRRLARGLGGNLRLARSSLGEGSTFILTIESGGGTRSVPPATGAAPAATDAQAQLPGVRILVVDDAPDNRLLVRYYLERAGAEVVIAADGEAGVEIALAKPFDLILMDIQMPGIDGYEAAAQLREGGYRNPIVALTANAMRGEKERSARAGFTEHLAKPIDRAMLVSVIRNATRAPHGVNPES